MALASHKQANEENDLTLSLPKETGLGAAPHIYLFQDFWCPTVHVQGVNKFQKHFHANEDDVFVASFPKSAWEFFTKMKSQSLPLSFEEAFEKYCNGIMLFGPWWSHMLGYWKENITRPNKVLFLKYEDLKEDTIFHVKRIAEFLDSPITQGGESDTVIENIIKLCRFETMKDLEVNKSGCVFSVVENKDFFRKGEIGDWINYFSPSMIEKLSKIIEEK
ncbi:hypothetical protein PHAVU_011G111600 [Phaseolus vulgaris]